MLRSFALAALMLAALTTPALAYGDTIKTWSIVKAPAAVADDLTQKSWSARPDGNSWSIVKGPAGQRWDRTY